MKVPTKPTVTHLIDEARAAARAYQSLAVCYRIGKQPSEKLFAQLKKANAAIQRWDAADAKPAPPEGEP